MNVSSPHKPIRVFVLGAISLAAGLGHSQAANYYLKGPPPTPNDWNAPGNYTLISDGSGGDAPAMAGNTFFLNTHAVGTSSGDTSFLGTSLTLDGGSLILRNGTNPTKTISSAIATGGSLVTFNTAMTLADTTFNNISGTTTFSPVGSGFGLTMNLGTLTGAGNFTLSGGTTTSYLFSPASASGYTGNITIGGASLASFQFGSNLTLGGGLIATDTGSRITLNQNITLASLTLNGSPLAANTYSFSALNSLADTIFVDGGSGSITVGAVPEPTTAAFVLGTCGLMLVMRRRKNLH